MAKPVPDAEASAEWECAVKESADLRREILASGEKSDVKFAVGRELGEVNMFSAHQFILGMRGSDVLRTLCKYKDGHEPVEIPEILPDAFGNMLKYIYTGSVNNGLKTDNVFETIHCADKYNLPGLTAQCLSFVRTDLSAVNCVVYLDNIKRCVHDCVAFLEGQCLELVDKFSRTALQSADFLTIAQETLKTIVQRSTLSIDEDSLYTVVEKWSVAACNRENLEPSQANRRQMLGDALYLVRFPLLSDTELADGPVKSKLLLEKELLDIYQFRHASSKLHELPFPTEHRTGSVIRIPRGYAQLARLEGVFVESDTNHYWYPAVVMGICGSEVSVSRDGGRSTQHCKPHQIARAAEILQLGNEIKTPIFSRRYLTVTLVAHKKDVYTVDHQGQRYRRGCMELGLSSGQMMDWIRSHGSHL